MSLKRASLPLPPTETSQTGEFVGKPAIVLRLIQSAVLTGPDTMFGLSGVV